MSGMRRGDPGFPIIKLGNVLQRNRPAAGFIEPCLSFPAEQPPTRPDCRG
jgi:hypothetical protein